MGQDYKRLNHSVSLINFHFVWIPKRRKKILVGQIAERLDALLHEKCKDLGLEIIALEIQSDHVHLFVNALPKFAPRDIAFLLKGYTSRMLRAEFPGLKTVYPRGKDRSLWTNSYFVSTAGNVSSETVRRYIEGHSTR